MKTAKLLTIFSLLAIGTFFMYSCQGDPAEPTPVEYGKILLFNGAPGGAPVDLYMDGTKSTATSLSYGQSSNYIQAVAGATARKILTKNVTGATIDSVSLKVNKDVGYSYYIYT